MDARTPSIPADRSSEANTAVIARGEIAHGEEPPTTEPPATEREVPEDPLIGRSIAGKYRISAQIAKGGMGRIYRAEQAPLGRLVAIKVVNAKFAADDPEYEKRFFLEASVVSQLTHPNTVTVFDYGKTEDDIYFMAMELLAGRTVHRALKAEGPFPALRALNIVRQVCRSVREAHDLGVVHRDLKPANVFLAEHPDEEDFVKVLDFGLAKHMGESADEQLTQTGLFMGSPKYMAPEQVDGRNLDGRADIYSTGILFFEILTGRVPFEKSTSVTTLMAHVTDPVPPMASVAPEGTVIPPAVEAVVRRCLEKKPEDRYPSMDALLLALKEAEAEMAVPPVAGSPAPLPSVAPSPLLEATSPMVARRLTPTPSTPLSRNLWIAFAFFVASALGGGGAFLYARAPSSPRPAGEGSPAAGSTSRVALTSETTSRAPSVQGTIPSSTQGSSPSLPVTFETTPPGAEIRDENRVLCEKTPCTLQMDPAALDQMRNLSATKAGFVKDNRRMTLRDGYQITLTRPVEKKVQGAASASPQVDGFKGAY